MIVAASMISSRLEVFICLNEACDILLDLYSKEKNNETKTLLKSITNTIPNANSEYKKFKKLK